MAIQFPTPERRASLISNTLGIVGFIILIAVLIWGLFHLITLAKPWFASTFPNRNDSAIVVTAPKTNIPSGTPIAVSWKHSPKGDGTYSFVYQCQAGFQFRINGNALPCGTSYTLPATTKTISLTPIAMTATSTAVKVPFTVMFYAKPSSQATGTKPAGFAQGNASITVISSAKPAPTVPLITATPPKTATPAVSKPAGHADLSIRILQVGVIHPITGELMPRSPMSPNEVVAVRFDIANNGGSSTGTWYFSAQLPTIPQYPYTSPAQAPLAPGAHIESMLRFAPAQGGGIFSVTVDPSNQVRETNESNNFVQQNI